MRARQCAGIVPGHAYLVLVGLGLPGCVDGRLPCLAAGGLLVAVAAGPGLDGLAVTAGRSGGDVADPAERFGAAEAVGGQPTGPTSPRMTACSRSGRPGSVTGPVPVRPATRRATAASSTAPRPRPRIVNT